MLRRIVLFFFMTTIFCLFTGTALHAQIAINNSSFDDETLGESTFTDNVQGWQIFGSAGTFNPGTAAFADESGTGTRENTAYSNGGTISQVLNEVLVEGETYTLSVDVGRRSDHAGNPTYIIELRAGGLEIARFADLVGNLTSGEFVTRTLTLTASADDPIGSPLEIRLSATDVQANFDNVSLATASNPGTPPDGGDGPTSPGTPTTCVEIPQLVTEDLTLNIPDDFADVDAALDCLDLRIISRKATVTIQVADGIYEDWDTIHIEHPDGARVRLLGNVDDPSACEIRFVPRADGIVVDHVHALGLINGFTLVGGDGSGAGLLAQRGSSITAGKSLIVENFENGVVASKVSFIQAPETISRNNTNFGFLALSGSMIEARNCEATGNVGGDSAARQGARVDARGCFVADNGS